MEQVNPKGDVVVRRRDSGGIRGDHKSGKLKYIPSSPFGAPEFKNTAACCK